MPLALAVVPAQATAALARQTRRAEPGVDVLQHGYAHVPITLLAPEKSDRTGDCSVPR
jgi:hypothetical protein